ncbi:hypothetical protein RUND412_003570 [Rhizina undulata]
MAALKVGDKFPEGVTFSYVPYNPETGINACGRPTPLEVSSAWADKKVVLFSVPGSLSLPPLPLSRQSTNPKTGAFTPTCSERHLPGYIQNLPALRAKGVDVVAVVAFNDPHVMSAWSKAQGIKDEEILFLSDEGARFARAIGWNQGERLARFAIVLERGKVLYAEKDEKGVLDVSDVGTLLI